MSGQDGHAASGAGGYALGVDLGTSNTVAVLRWPDGRTRPLLFDGQPIMPSGVYVDQVGLPHVGRDALRLAQADPARYEPNPKRRVDERSVLLGDRETPIVDLLAAILGAVARAAVEAVGFLPPAAVTYPAAWGARRRDVLAAAIARAGWPPVASPGVPGTVLLPEPVAAARYFADVLRRPVPAGSALTVFDFGGGTLDVAVVRNEGPDGAGRAGFAVIGSGGVAELGGLDLDAALVEHLGGLLGDSTPEAWQRLAHPRTAVDWRNRRQFWDDVRGAKEMLSRSASAPVPVPGVDQAAHLTREELEHVIAPLLRRGVFEAARVLADSGVPRERQAGLFLVGGSSRVPLVARLLHAELGLAPTVLEQPELPVAEGALTELAPPVHAAIATAAPAAGPPAAAAPPYPGSSVPVSSGLAPAAAPGELAGPHPPQPVTPHQPPHAPPDPGMGVSPYPKKSHGPGPARTPMHRRAVTWLAAAAALAVLAAAGGLALYLNRAPGDLRFTDVREIERVSVGADRPDETFTHVVGDRAYLAWDEGDQLELVAVDAATGEERWRHTVSERFDRWTGIRGFPGLVLATAYASASADPRPMFALDPNTGAERWRRDIHGDDRIWVFDDALVLADNKGDRLVGLDPDTGRERWRRDNPKDQYGYTDATVVGSITEADLNGPAAVDGAPLATDLADDHRLVQIGSDRAARVIDARSGRVVAERGNVGDTNGHYVAYGGELFASGAGREYQIVAYDLTDMGKPRIVYQPADAQRGLEELDPCGAERLCLLDSRSSAADSVEVAAVDADGGQAWRHKAPGADHLVPVGDRVLIESTGADPGWALRGSNGEPLADREGTAARLDAGNVLSFTGTFSTSPADLSVAGVSAGSGLATELGPLPQARGETCSWNTSVIACMADTEFVLWRFAED